MGIKLGFGVFCLGLALASCSKQENQAKSDISAQFAPTVSSITPLMSHFKGGDVIVIQGSGFIAGKTKVKFARVEASPVRVNTGGTQITTISPKIDMTGLTRREVSITVENDGAITTFANKFVYSNNLPVAKDDTYNTEAGTTLKLFATNENTAIVVRNDVHNLLNNDYDVDKDLLDFRVTESPKNGRIDVSLCSDAEDPTAVFCINYTANVGFGGMDSFKYVVNDGSSNSAPATVNIYVGNLPKISYGKDNVLLVSEKEDAITIGKPNVLLGAGPSSAAPFKLTKMFGGEYPGNQVMGLTFNPANGQFSGTITPGTDMGTYWIGNVTYTDKMGKSDTAPVTLKVKHLFEFYYPKVSTPLPPFANDTVVISLSAGRVLNPTPTLVSNGGRFFYDAYQVTNWRVSGSSAYNSFNNGDMCINFDRTDGTFSLPNTQKCRDQHGAYVNRNNYLVFDLGIRLTDTEGTSVGKLVSVMFVK